MTLGGGTFAQPLEADARDCDARLVETAQMLGLQPQWRDQFGALRHVAPDVLRKVSAAIVARIPEEMRATTIVANAHAPLSASPELGAGWMRIEFESGGAREVFVDAQARALPPIDRIGYHRLIGPLGEATVAICPDRAFTITDVANNARLWGVTVQNYGAQRNCIFRNGDYSAIGDLSERFAQLGADALALSPDHALFSGDSCAYSPYSPSNRLFRNVLHAAPEEVFGVLRVRALAARLGLEAGLSDEYALIDWPRASAIRFRFYRALFAEFQAREMRTQAPLARAFQAFCADDGGALARHALFEALHGAQFALDPAKWNWRTWAPSLRSPDGLEARIFAERHRDEIQFHAFLQWITERSAARAQARAKNAGMKIGLISDLAIGVSAGGGQVWADPSLFLEGVSIGAPEDELAPQGQCWGLAPFSPHALRAAGFKPFLDIVRAALRHAGGVRIDHVLGLRRLWLTPGGADGRDGVYLDYPCDELLALLRLESARHQAIVIGEDLGVAPDGYREKLRASGLAGMRVFQFERDGATRLAANAYPRDAVAMTATHDTPTSAGLLAGRDIDWRENLNILPQSVSAQECRDNRNIEIVAINASIDQPSHSDNSPISLAQTQDLHSVDARAAGILRFVGSTPANLALAPMEDVLGRLEQPNLPGTTTEHPNWRRRYPAADDVFSRPDVLARLEAFDRARKS